MMKYLILFMGLFFQFSVFAQVDTTIYTFGNVEKKAETPLKSEAEWIDTLKSMVKYPEIARKYELEGRVVVQFVVEKDGKLSNAKVISFRSNRSEIFDKWSRKNKNSKEPIDVEAVLSQGEKALKNAAIEMMNISPPFIPAKNKGQFVRSQFVIPIGFGLY